MDRNEVATSFRLVNKAAAAQFSGPEYATVRLWQPVPPHAFAAHWLAPDATWGLTLKQRRKLLWLTAFSGVVTNLEVAEHAAGCPPTYEVFEAAVIGGHMGTCQWLYARGCPTSCSAGAGSGLLCAAAYGGHRHVCEWLLSLGLAWSSWGDAGAAHGGHVGLMEWLQEERRTRRGVRDGIFPWFELMHSVTSRCDLAALKRLWPGLDDDRLDLAKCMLLHIAAGSRTSDWAAKVEWLEARGCLRDASCAASAAERPDAVSRLTWLRARGYPADVKAVMRAANAGNMPALRYLLSEAGVRQSDPAHPPSSSVTFNAEHLQPLEALHAAGWLLDAGRLAQLAAEGGRLHVLAWLVETFQGAEAGSVRLNADLFRKAARSGSVELLAWLRERGCAWDEGIWEMAAGAGCEEALEWLAERGCPMPADGGPYVAACANRDLLAVRCLRRLGMPWGPAAAASEAVRSAPAAMADWLREAGCLVDDVEVTGAGIVAGRCIVRHGASELTTSATGTGGIDEGSA
ncbi:hypothetical protein GPECTOR_125g510 [Gonium pectorale]|uniref:Ankyrin repeat domain-containing protein n=1 Tax=Gonium pectorale TaxID=33097 RepID=A0A150FYL6_GONPE|nr:hypothetical protein GPECTOR_125g510 [Gonium pectorale]|eukprot:KXZ42677.1 hypothetical protein GPECTOR_125g510 [Gonium pectorale]